jgi:hypothetical protein
MLFAFIVQANMAELKKYHFLIGLTRFNTASKSYDIESNLFFPSSGTLYDRESKI